MSRATVVPPHAIRAGDIVVWKQLCLRGAGFPAAFVLGLDAPETSRQIDAALDEERRGIRAFRDARPALETTLRADWQRIGERLRALAREPRFREAVLWQNRAVVRTGIEPLLRSPADAMDSNARRRSCMVASYLQRYCLKNDSIGFFGPMGWGTLDDGIASPTLAPGRALLARRTVYFEHWAIDALAGQLSADRALRVGLAPRHMPTVRLDGGRLHHPIDRVTQLPAPTVRLLESCDGTRSARAIAELLVAEPALGFDATDEVYDLLDELVEAKIVIWRLEVPTAGFAPEGDLGAALAAAEPSAARTAGQAALAELVAARDRVAAAAGDPGALDAALGALEACFVRLTDRAASRRAGETSAGRGLVYEDCRRDVDIVLGRPFVERIAPGLSWLEASARWFTYTLAVRFRALFDQVYRDLVAQGGGPEVDFIRFCCELRPHVTQSTILRDVRDELQRRWGELLALPPGEHRVELRAADLGPRVQAAFAAPAPGWPTARHSSPDLMICAAGPEAFARGEYLVVLGELHMAASSMTTPALAKEHVDPAAIHRARQADLGPLVGQVEPRGIIHRASYYSLGEGNLDVELGDTRSHRPREHVLDVAGLVVSERAGRVCAHRRDGSTEFDLMGFLRTDLGLEALSLDILGPVAHVPRVTVEGFVLARERWCFASAALDFARLATLSDRFAGVRRWAATHQIPRFTFVKVSSEAKPVYLDLDSPVFVELFCKLVRAAETVTVSEMLPAFDQLWLRDAEGAAYCSEIRMVMVDDDAIKSAP